MTILGHKFNPLELALGIVGTLASVAAVLVPAHAAKLICGVFGAVAALFIVHWTISKARTSHLVVGVAAVMAELSNLAENSRSCVWTVRSHVGEAANEDGYFQILASRILKGEIEDFRRVICLNKANSTKFHLHWLVDKFADQQAVKVRYLKSSTALFDFAVFDGRQAAFGFPQAEGEGFQGAVFTKHPAGVKGLENAFQLLWAHGTELFSGSSHVMESDKRQIKKRIDDELALLTIDPHIGA